MVLGVVARRLAGSRVGFLAVSRSAEDAFFDRGGLPVHEVLPLSDAAAAELVGDRFPALAPQVSRRLLAEAQGNPAGTAGAAGGAQRHATLRELADHVPHALWLTLDLTEAAIRTGRHAEAVAHVAAVRQAGAAAFSPRQGLTTGGAAAIAAPHHEAVALFEQALSVAGADRWPFDRARIQLAFGERLRRTKATTDARADLTAALDTFQRLGAAPWTARAGGELRATGLTIGHLPDAGPGSLTPQQLQIATLAAAGLTNKQIGERLYLSPRTVATHLHQLFPKLGVTTRAALGDALADLPAERP